MSQQALYQITSQQIIAKDGATKKQKKENDMGTRPRIDLLHSKYILFAQKLSKSVMNVSEITFYQVAKGRQMMEILQGFSEIEI